MSGSVPAERFHVLEVIAANATEILERAFDRTLQREVLLERPGPGVRTILQKSTDQSRILREARALAKLRHPGIIRLLDVLPAQDGTTLVLEPVQGETLAQRLTREPKLPPEEVRTIGIEICQALEVVHAADIVHRGIAEHAVIQRPDGSVCLTGFVFAKFGGHEISVSSSLDYQANEPKSGSGEPVALPRHPAPEQLTGEVAGPRSDLFALGCVLYRCLTGVTAFDEARAEIWTGAADPRDLASDLPRDLSLAIMKCLARSPVGRFPSASDLRAALESGQQRTTPKPGSGLRRQTMLVVATGLIAAVGLWAFSGSSNGDRSPPGIAKDHADHPGRYSPTYNKSRAVIIGITQYDAFSKLPNAESDALAVSKALNEMRDWDPKNVSVLCGSTATRVRILDALGDAAEVSEPDDRILVYYAGHGRKHERSEESGWIIPVDGRPDREDRNHLSWIHLDDLAAVFRSDAKHILIVLDCCFGGRLVRVTRGEGVTSRRSLSRERCEQDHLTRRAHLVLASTDGDKTALDGVEGENSPFATALLEAFRSVGKDVLTSSQLYAHIGERMLNASHGSGTVPVQRAAPRDQGAEFVFFLK